MYYFRKPAPETLQRIFASQQGLAVTYEAVGVTKNLTEANAPKGFVVDHTRALLGTGPEVFQTAKAALSRWQHYEFDWLEIYPQNVPLETERVVGTVAKAMGLWWVNVCKIVYTLDEPTRFGFAYGTMPEHVECGEERFLLELHDNGEVWYDIHAFSRPYHWMTKLGYPLVRRLQKRFGRDSVAAMKLAIAEIQN